jgi:two-component system sensor histidine kinase/response regulator
MLERELIGQAKALMVMDTRILREFLELLGPEGPSLLRSVVDAYLKETPPVVEDLGEALGRSDYSHAAWLAHKLKGSCLSIGASRLAAHCSELEELCRAQLMPPAAAYAAILSDFTATRRTLKAFIKDMA